MACGVDVVNELSGKAEAIASVFKAVRPHLVFQKMIKVMHVVTECCAWTGMSNPLCDGEQAFTTEFALR
ncbi:hypothetical protein D3C85_1757800 [compost metagenome]